MGLMALALIASTYTVAPTTALTTGVHPHLNRQIGHEGIAKRINSKRSNTKRCKKRPSASASLVSSSTKPAESTTKAQATPPPENAAPPPKPKPTSSAAPAPPPAPPANSGGGGGGKVGLAWPNGLDGLSTYATSAVSW